MLSVFGSNYYFFNFFNVLGLLVFGLVLVESFSVFIKLEIMFSSTVVYRLTL